MIIRLFLIVGLLVVFAAPALSQTPCTRYSTANFSICRPSGWVDDSADGKFKSFSDKTSGSTTANLNFNEDANNAMGLGEYVDASNKYTLEHSSEAGFTSLSQLSRTAFAVDPKESGFKTVFAGELKGGLKIVSFQFMFDTGKSKLMITFTCFESGRGAYEKVFDETVKTLTLTPSTS